MAGFVCLSDTGSRSRTVHVFAFKEDGDADFMRRFRSHYVLNL